MIKETFVLGELQTNTYLLFDELSNEALLIDPADDAEFLNEELLRRSLQLKAVLLTHGHFDHLLALLPLRLAWQMPIYLHPQDNFLLEQAQNSAEHWLKRPTDPLPSADLTLEENQELKIASLRFQVIHLPGHTPGSVAFLFPREKYFFSGDTLFQNGVGSTAHRYSNKQQLFQSLKKIKNLNQAGKIAEIFPGHGESFFPSF